MCKPTILLAGQRSALARDKRSYMVTASGRHANALPKRIANTRISVSPFDVKSFSNTAVGETRASLLSRRTLLSTFGSVAICIGGSPASAAEVDVLEDVPGTGSRGARRGDLLLFHYVGRLESTGQVFDSTRGGLTYRDGGPGIFRPAAIALGGGPVPGICEGLQRALEGMTIGGKRTVRVSAVLGFGSQTVLAPYGIVPGDSTLLYEVELLRLSAVGPDQLTKGILKCGAGGANQQAENCGNISYAEFL